MEAKDMMNFTPATRRQILTPLHEENMLCVWFPQVYTMYLIVKRQGKWWIGEADPYGGESCKLANDQDDPLEDIGPNDSKPVQIFSYGEQRPYEEWEPPFEKETAKGSTTQFKFTWGDKKEKEHHYAVMCRVRLVPDPEPGKTVAAQEEPTPASSSTPKQPAPQVDAPQEVRDTKKRRVTE